MYPPFMIPFHGQLLTPTQHIASLWDIAGVRWGTYAVCAILLFAALRLIAEWRYRRSSSKEAVDQEIAAAFGAQCPNCSALLSEQRGGSWENRRCVVCGFKFGIRD